MHRNAARRPAGGLSGPEQAAPAGEGLHGAYGVHMHAYISCWCIALHTHGTRIPAGAPLTKVVAPGRAACHTNPCQLQSLAVPSLRGNPPTHWLCNISCNRLHAQHAQHASHAPMLHLFVVRACACCSCPTSALPAPPALPLTRFAVPQD